MILIDAEELERDGWHLYRTVQVDRNTMEYQTKKPTAFTTLEVVRCKDCKHRQEDTIFHKLYCDGREVVADGFCWKGERRSDE